MVETSVHDAVASRDHGVCARAVRGRMGSVATDDDIRHEEDDGDDDVDDVDTVVDDVQVDGVVRLLIGRCFFGDGWLAWS